MKIIIDMPREQYGLIMQSHRPGVERYISKEAMMYAIKNGTLLPKGCGRLGDLSKIYVELNEAQIEGTEEYKGLGRAKQIVCNASTIVGTDKDESVQVELAGDGYADGKLVYDYGVCPECGWTFEEDDKDWEEPFCCHCGQKLKWFEK